MRSIYEKRAQKELEQEGYLVDYKSRPFRTPKGYMVDYFGRFDLLAYRTGEIRCIAIKGHGGVSKTLRESIRSLTFPFAVTREIWTYGRNKKIKKEIIK